MGSEPPSSTMPGLVARIWPISVTAVCGFDWLSLMTNLTGRPLMPPVLFTDASTIASPLASSVPKNEAGPVSGNRMLISKGSAAPTGPMTSVSAAAATAARARTDLNRLSMCYPHISDECVRREIAADPRALPAPA